MRRSFLNINPESLIPKLPRPRDLQPFPNALALEFKGHESRVRSISVHPTGQWLASGGDDGSVRVWEVATGRCHRVFSLGGVVQCVAWNPNAALCLLSAAVDNRLLLLYPGVAGEDQRRATRAVLRRGRAARRPSPVSEGGKALTKKRRRRRGGAEAPAGSADIAEGVLLTLTHEKTVKQITWHARGDYFAAVCPEANTRGVVMHQLSRFASQAPFKKGSLKLLARHEALARLLKLLQNVRVYNLAKQELTKKLQTGVKWVSSLDVHPTGDHVVVGSYDKRLCWFDLDLSTRPYKTLRYHAAAIRQVSYSPGYPLFASCSDDGTVQVFHGMVYADLLQNPLIVPVKILKAHTPVDHLGVLDTVFHPTQPWVFSCGADKIIRLFANH
eukprot:tig00000382_g24574.t1